MNKVWKIYGLVGNWLEMDWNIGTGLKLYENCSKIRSRYWNCMKIYENVLTYRKGQGKDRVGNMSKTICQFRKRYEPNIWKYWKVYEPSMGLVGKHVTKCMKFVWTGKGMHETCMTAHVGNGRTSYWKYTRKYEKCMNMVKQVGNIYETKSKGH